ncbi:MAG: type II and III secretion system protein family protein [Acidobacteriaceae bacterium]
MSVKRSFPVEGFLAIVLLSATLCAAQTMSTNASGQTSQVTNDLSVTVGKSMLIDTQSPIIRVAVGPGNMALVQGISPTEVLVNGEKEGQTSLIIWEQGGQKQLYSLTIRPSEADMDAKLRAVRQEMYDVFPDQHITVSGFDGTVFLRGTVDSLDASNRAQQIAATAGKVVNLLYVKVPASKPQILLKVRFASLDRSKERDLGLNFFSTGATNSIGGITTGQFSPPTISFTGGAGSATVSNGLNLEIFRPDLNLGATIEALQTLGVVQVLAEPNVLAEDGKEASFLAGGQYPYPVVQNAGAGGTPTVTIEFKEYGIQLNFIPTITPRNTIQLQVAPSVSELDYANGVSLNGFQVPGIDVRNVNTEVELKNGQSFVIGGLLDNQETKTFEKIPFIGDIPILGKFFQSVKDTKNNTELVVIVTPEIVKPIAPGQPQPTITYPDKFLPPTDKTPFRNPEPATAETPQPSAVIPVETLQKDMQPEKKLSAPTSMGATGGGGGGVGIGGGI